MTDWMRGRPTSYCVTSTVGDGGNKTLQLAPAAGQRFIIHECEVWHDDNGGARDTIVLIYGTGGTHQITRSTVSLAAWTRLSVFASVTGESTIGEHKSRPIILNHGEYIQVTVNTLGAGKYSHIDAFVTVQRGVPEWV